MLTIAYIGNGKSTNRYHIPFAQKIPEIKIKTIYARSNPVNSLWEKLQGINYVRDINKIWQDETIQLVVLATPVSTHYELAMTALKHNKNVLVEKPFVETAQQARKLFSVAKEKGLFIQAYQNRRFDGDFLTVQKVISSGRLGDILEVEMHFDYYRPEIPENTPTFRLVDSYLYAHGCHTIDQVLSYWGNPERIHYEVRQLLGRSRMNDYFDLDFFYGPTKISIKSSYFRLLPRPSFIIHGKKGRFIKQTKDIQEEQLKNFQHPSDPDFGCDVPDRYGILSFIDAEGNMKEEKIITEKGDYSQFYQGVYDSIVYGKEKIVKDEQTMRLSEILEEGIATLNGKP